MNACQQLTTIYIYYNYNILYEYIHAYYTCILRISATKNIWKQTVCKNSCTPNADHTFWDRFFQATLGKRGSWVNHGQALSDQQRMLNSRARRKQKHQTLNFEARMTFGYACSWLPFGDASLEKNQAMKQVHGVIRNVVVEWAMKSEECIMMYL